MASDLPSLRQRIAALESELDSLKRQATLLEAQTTAAAALPTQGTTGLPMELDEYERYGRQMILPGLGLPAQLKLRNASVLVVGAGALGCPALQYLTAAGVGHIGIVDHDTVSRSNLHRQILHSELTIGQLKVDSVRERLQALNPHVRLSTYPEPLTPSNAMDLFNSFDLILDCTDRPLTRYLISDAAVHSSRPLISGAALGFNGQIAIYNWGEDGPCYRCVWPRVSKGKAGGGSCEEEGVMGGVTGVVGTLMALEAVKLLTGLIDPVSHPPSLTTFSSLSSTPFRTFKIRKRQPHCRSCGTPPLDSPLGGKIGSLEEEDYEAFCGGKEVDRDVSGLEEVGLGLGRIGVQELEAMLSNSDEAATVDLIDVRTPEQFSIVSIPGSRNVPLYTFLSNPTSHLSVSSSSDAPTVILCRRGNDSQEAARALVDAWSAESKDGGGRRRVVDVRGGVKNWGRVVRGGVEGGWPEY